MLDIKTLRLMAQPRARRRKPRPTRPNRRAELAYKADLLEIVKALRVAIEGTLLPTLKRTAPEYQRQAANGFAGDIQAALEATARQMLTGIDRMAARLAALVVQRQAQETDRQLAAGISRGLGVSPEVAESIRTISVAPQIEAAVLANVALIRSLPAQALDKIQGMVMSNITRGRRYEAIAKDIETQLGIAESRAKLIARDQMAKVNSAITEAKQKALGIAEYEWSTVGDERVRETHAANNGRVFRWDRPPPTGHPGEEINCRCVAIPVFRLDDE